MTDRQNSPQSSLATPLIIGLLIFIGFSRYLPLEHPWLFNFSPTLAVFLFCGAYLTGRWGWSAPLIAIILSDLFLNPTYGANFVEPFMLATLGTYLLVWALGKKIGSQSSLIAWVSITMSAPILFHVITCSLAWAVNPAYVKSFSGLIQAIFIGEPGYAPSYLFLRNSILGTLFFSLSFRWIHGWLSQKFPIRNDTIQQAVNFYKNAVDEPQTSKRP